MVMNSRCSGSFTVLPEPGKRNALVTSALPYVNNTPTLAISSGTDEYGTTTEARALAEGCTPQELCDKYRVIHADVYKWFNISFDIFGRTTTELQTVITQDIFLKLNHNGYLKERETTQLYCETHHSFLADRFVEGECPLLDTFELKNPRCKVDGSTPITKETNHIFIELDKLQPEAITSAWLKEELKPRSITRDMKWGTKVPLSGYDDKVIYPLFDACIGYVSITACYTTEWEKWWRNHRDVQLFQFLGKDNVVFHSIIFPATQIGTHESWTKLHHLSTTEYLTYENGKFFKSRNISVFGDSPKRPGLLLMFGDSFEYLIARKALLKNLGNFVSRVRKFIISRNYDSVIPDWAEYHEDSFSAFKDGIAKLLTRYIQELDAVNLRSGMAIILAISQQGNVFLQSNKLDGSLSVNEPAKCAAVISIAVNLAHLIASLLAPYMPDTADSINKQLAADPLPILDYWSADAIKPGHKIGKAEHLFRPIKPEKAQEWRRASGADEAKKAKEEEAALKAKKTAALKAVKAVAGN
ncbi:methionyl-tRNA synthetase [Xylariaceae sp. FL1019]|nr:methionyl-tRNA synthetase [Xylariaceae sp. FL1019]